MFAALIFFSTGTHPSAVLGASTIASTPWVIKLLSACTCFSWLPCASTFFRLMPRLGASTSNDFVSAVRQALSAPICENPTVTALPEPFGPADCVVDAVLGPPEDDDEDDWSPRSHAASDKQNAAINVASGRVSVRGMVRAFLLRFVCVTHDSLFARAGLARRSKCARDPRAAPHAG